MGVTMKMNLKALITVTSLLMLCSVAFAGVSPEESARLKTDLMPLGGEKAGNKEGTIPAWDGGYTKVPAGFTPGGDRPSPFADEKPLFSITAANMSQYENKLDEGQIFLLKKYPDTYKLQIYPTHRTASAPQWVYDETFKNATRCVLDGYGVKNAFGGPAFPIPKSGLEVMWNHNLRIHPPAFSSGMTAYNVDDAGYVSVATKAVNEFCFPNYNPANSYENIDNVYLYVINNVSAPPFRAGEILLFHNRMDGDQRVWQYLVGQRRIRRLPMFSYDTPNFINSGVDFVDESYVWLGPLDHYDWKIVGKREMYIPYNNNAMYLTPDRTVMGKHHLNPDVVRWELHRVWEVEGILRQGQRDVRPRRKVYVDEDSWIGVIGNTWDAKGEFWHTTMSFPEILYDVPCVHMDNFCTMDLQQGRYVYMGSGDEEFRNRIEKPWPTNFFSPEEVAARGVR